MFDHTDQRAGYFAKTGLWKYYKNRLVRGQVNLKHSLVLAKRYLSDNDQSFDHKQNGQIKNLFLTINDVRME